MGAKGSKIGTVKNPSATTFDGYWNTSTNEVHVESKHAGFAASSSDALRKADYYATTTVVLK